MQTPPAALVCPPGHAVQPAVEVTPAAPAPKPAGHGRHDAGDCEYIRAGHVETVKAQVEEAAGLYAPAAHVVQRVEPALAAVPALQGMEAKPSVGQ